MMKPLQKWLIPGVGAAAVALLFFVIFTSSPMPETPPKPVLAQTFDKSPTGFTFQYPEDWVYIIPAQGILVAGFPMTLHEGEPGPTFTAQRLNPLSVVGSIELALDRYMRNGPLRLPERWRVVMPVYGTSLDGREAYAAELEGSDVADGEPMHTRFIITAADNTFVYMFITAVPVTMQARYTPLLDAVLASVRLLE